MNDTTVIGVAEGVAAYVREVRAELADLPIEDVDDLTGGMEADLSELAAESGGDLVGRLGAPKLYAAELRSAAGLPERADGSGRRRRRSFSEQASLDRASFTSLTERHPWLRSVTAFLVALRPAWWLVRGYLAAWALWSMFGGDSRGVRPHSFLELVMALAAIVVSVQIGRGWLRHRKLSRPLLAMANSILVIVALVASVSVDANYDPGGGYNPPGGVSLNGAQVGNIYAYDSDGNRITGVRLFDQEGSPLNGEQSFFDANGNPMGVVRDSSGASLTNVYPRALVGSDPWQITDPNQQWGHPVWTPPMSIVPLIPSATATSTATPTATAPTATATTPPPTATATSTAPTAPSKPAPTKTSSPTPSPTTP